VINEYSMHTLSEAQVRRVCRVVSWAQSHWYEPLKKAGAPSDDPNHWVKIGRYRCVFSFSVEQRTRKVFRHLVIKAKGKVARLVEAFEIAEAFGFTGWDGKSADLSPAGWLVDSDKEAGSVVLMQEAWPPEGSGVSER
jgi:hypothetical protein